MKVLNSFILCLALTFIGPSFSFAEHHEDGEEVKMEAPQAEKAMSKKEMKKKKIAKKKKRHKKRMAKKKRNKKAKKNVE